MRLCWRLILLSFICLRQSLITFIHEQNVRQVEKSNPEDTVYFCPEMDMSLFLPGSRWACESVWSAPGFCCFYNYLKQLQLLASVDTCPRRGLSRLVGVPGDTSIFLLHPQLPATLNTRLPWGLSMPIQGGPPLLVPGSKVVVGQEVPWSLCSGLSLSGPVCLSLKKKTFLASLPPSRTNHAPSSKHGLESNNSIIGSPAMSCKFFPRTIFNLVFKKSQKEVSHFCTWMC